MQNQSDRHHPDLDRLLDSLPQKEAARLLDVWTLAAYEEPLDVQAVDDALHRLEASLDASEQRIKRRIHTPRALHRAEKPPRRASRRNRALWRVGAVAIVVILIGAAGLFWWLKPSSYTAPLGQHLALTLPDGSLVELNSGSTLRHARRFGDVRAVTLIGEAYFDVAQEQRPFVAETFNARIRVLGTRFNVRAWPGGLEPETTVALEEGRIALAASIRPDQTVAMEPGQLRRVAGGVVETLDESERSVVDATAWRQGDLIIKNQHLDVVLDEVERRFAVSLQVEQPSLLQRQVYLELRQPPDAEAVVHDVAVALGLRYRATSDGYVLYTDAP